MSSNKIREKYALVAPSDLRRMFSYDPDTGSLRWKYRPECNATWNARYEGREVSSVGNGGYLVVRITTEQGRRNFQAHVVAWAIVYGEWPSRYVDHIDGNRRNNRIKNLRQVTCRQNHHNTHKVKSPWGFKGVCKPPHTSRFRATIRINGKNKYLGYFGTPEEAARAYDKAALEQFGEYAATNASLGLLGEVA